MAPNNIVHLPPCLGQLSPHPLMAIWNTVHLQPPFGSKGISLYTYSCALDAYPPSPVHGGRSLVPATPPPYGSLHINIVHPQPPSGNERISMYTYIGTATDSPPPCLGHLPPTSSNQGNFPLTRVLHSSAIRLAVWILTALVHLQPPIANKGISVYTYIDVH